ncbi:uncharacterized protein EAF01_000489 [Botrytis porri]|uniref:uncharacterized protein n=1 Tax=Botrytis porri TaxID=87229 RepID=UPI0019017574|nr:uncharacterized protein EAF01_000489 [Botrytis porri]KAF7914083.1 hypothetical protein EAF01_000489 [Botrytis porri]
MAVDIEVSDTSHRHDAQVQTTLFPAHFILASRTHFEATMALASCRYRKLLWLPYLNSSQTPSTRDRDLGLSLRRVMTTTTIITWPFKTKVPSRSPLLDRTMKNVNVMP